MKTRKRLMAAEYLKHYSLYWNYPVVEFNYGSGDPLTTPEGMAHGDFVKGMNFKVMALRPLFDLISSRLRKAKIHTKPKTTHIQTRLAFHTSNYVSWTLPEPHHLFHEYYVHPSAFLDLPFDAKLLGELAIDVVGDLLQTLDPRYQPLQGLPVDIFNSSIQSFKEQSYVAWFDGKPRPIEGTKLKSQLLIGASGGETSRKMAIKYRGKTLFEKNLEPTRAGLYNGLGNHSVYVEKDRFRLGFLNPDAANGEILFDELPSDAMKHIVA